MRVILESIGVFSFAISGALLAVRRDFDVVGIVALAVITATGGGILRDVILGATPPAAFTQWTYFSAAITAAVVTALFHPTVERLSRPVLIFDAAGLGFFCVVGTLKAIDYGLGPLPAAALGVITGVGGGMLRDIVARETPSLVDRTSELYAIPAALGSLTVAIAWEYDVYRPALGAVVAVAIVAVRLGAIKWRWHGPGARAPSVRRAPGDRER